MLMRLRITTTAMQATRTGSMAGLTGRSNGAAATGTGAVLQLSLTTAPRVSQTGSKAGLIPRRPGAATSITRAAQSPHPTTAQREFTTGSTGGRTQRRPIAVQRQGLDVKATTLQSTTVMQATRIGSMAGLNQRSSGAVTTSRKGARPQHSLHRDAMRAACSITRLPPATTVSSTLQPTSSLTWKMHVVKHTAKCRWSVIFAVPAQFRLQAAKGSA